jgi:hypothetical protein
MNKDSIEDKPRQENKDYESGSQTDDVACVVPSVISAITHLPEPSRQLMSKVDVFWGGLAALHVSIMFGSKQVSRRTTCFTRV